MKRLLKKIHKCYSGDENGNGKFNKFEIEFFEVQKEFESYVQIPTWMKLRMKNDFFSFVQENIVKDLKNCYENLELTNSYEHNAVYHAIFDDLELLKHGLSLSDTSMQDIESSHRQGDQLKKK